MSNEQNFKQEKKSNVLWYYIFTFYIILSTDSLIVGLNLIPTLQDLSYLIIILSGFLIFGLLLMRTRGKFGGNGIVGFVLSMLFVILSAIVNLDMSLMAPIKLGCLMLGFYIANKANTRFFLRAYIHIMVLFAIVSLIVFAFPDYFLGLDFFPEIEGYKGQVFKIFGLANLRVSLLGYRNWGPFWEPGVYQTYLIFAIVFLLFDDTGIKRKNTTLIILLVTLVTTFSTTGFLSIPFILLAYILHKPQKRSRAAFKLALLVAIISVTVWFVQSEFFELVFLSKFDDLDATGRNLTIEYGLKLWMQKPIFGFSSDYTQEMYEIAGNSFAITNTFIGNAIAYGTFMGVYSLVAIVMYAKSYKTKPLVFLLLAIGLILTMSGENYKFSPMICFLLFYRYKSQTICVNGEQL